MYTRIQCICPGDTSWLISTIIHVVRSGAKTWSLLPPSSFLVHHTLSLDRKHVQSESSHLTLNGHLLLIKPSSSQLSHPLTANKPLLCSRLLVRTTPLLVVHHPPHYHPHHHPVSRATELLATSFARPASPSHEFQFEQFSHTSLGKCNSSRWLRTRD